MAASTPSTSTASGRRGRPPRIARTDLIAAAIDLGLDTFSMREVAERVGVTTPSLYSHVANRAELHELATRELRGEVAGFVSTATDWRGWLVDFAAFVRARSGGSAAESLFGDIAVLRRADQHALGEPGLRLLLDAGLHPADAGRSVWLVFRLAAGAAALDTRGPGGANVLAGYLATTGELLADDTEDRAPATRKVQETMTADETFAFDLAVVLDGIAFRIAGRPTTPPPEEPT